MILGGTLGHPRPDAPLVGSSLADVYPKLAAQWDYEANLAPEHRVLSFPPTLSLVLLGFVVGRRQRRALGARAGGGRGAVSRVRDDSRGVCCLRWTAYLSSPTAHNAERPPCSLCRRAGPFEGPAVAQAAAVRALDVAGIKSGRGALEVRPGAGPPLEGAAQGADDKGGEPGVSILESVHID
jgi:hypothetical protein